MQQRDSETFGFGCALVSMFGFAMTMGMFFVLMALLALWVKAQPANQPIFQVLAIAPAAGPVLANSTPHIEPALNFQIWRSNDVIIAFKMSGLEAESPTPLTHQDYGMAPMGAVEGTHFLIPALCADCGGRIFNLPSSTDLEKLRAYYTDMAKSSAALYSHVLVRDNILVQINGDL
jgi:hypothetical protein